MKKRAIVLLGAIGVIAIVAATVSLAVAEADFRKERQLVRDFMRTHGDHGYGYDPVGTPDPS